MKRGSQRLRASLRREVHAAQKALEAQRRERGLLQAFHCGAGFGDLRQPGCGVLEVAEEVLVGPEGFGSLAGLLQHLTQVKLAQEIG